MAKKVKFAAPLNKPRIIKTLPSFAGPLLALAKGMQPDQKDLDDISNYQKDHDQRLRLLLKHYKLENKAAPWFELSMRLAQDFVPGFRISKGAGAPAKWKDSVAKVQAEMRAGGCGVAKAIDRLKGKEPAKWEGYTERRYYEQRKALRKLKPEL